MLLLKSFIFCRDRFFKPFCLSLNMGRSIGVLSLKGGVGKTSSVIALGYAFSELGKRVLLVDANFSAPNLGLHLNVLDPDHTLHSVLESSSNLSDAIYPLGQLDLLPASIFGRRDLNYFKLRDKIKPLKRKYDVILLDSSPALNEETFAVMKASDELLIVTTPDLPTLGITLKAVRLVKRVGIPVAGLILNKVHKKDFELSLEEIEEVVEVPVMAVIPHDVRVLKSLSEFSSPFEKASSKLKEEYMKLAAMLVGHKYESPKFKRMLSRFFRPQKQEINRTVYYERVFK